MKKLLFVLLLCASACMGQVGQTGPYDPGAARQVNTYTKAEADAQLGQVSESLRQGNLRYYFTKTEIVAGTLDLATTAPAVATEAAVFTVTSATLAAYTPPHISPSLGVSSLSIGEITWARFFSSNQSLTSGRSAYYAPELWSVDADGTSNPTFVATGSAVTVLSTDKQFGMGKFPILTATGMGGASPTTRRLMVKHYWKRTGVLTSNNPTITAWCGGEYSGNISLQLPSAVVMLTDGSNSVAQVQFKDGTAAAPSITFGSDPDTGIYRYGANVLGFATAGIDRLNIGDKLIGIGTGTPLMLYSGSSNAIHLYSTNLDFCGLRLQGEGSDFELFASNKDYSTFGIFSKFADDFQLWTNNAERLIV